MNLFRGFAAATGNSKIGSSLMAVRSESWTSHRFANTIRPPSFHGACAKQAAEAEFQWRLSHWEYAQFALQNAEHERGMVRARRIEVYAPQPGDIVHVNRDDGKVNFDRIRAGGYTSESGIVIDIAPGKALIVMGNQEPCGNIGTEELVLTEAGLLAQRARNPFT